MYYRQNIDINQKNQVSLNNYVKQNYPNYVDLDVDENINDISKKGYNFDETLDYYMNRNENSIVGIIDKNPNKLSFDEPDVFKIRSALKKGDIKRGTGITTLKGTVCSTAGTRDKLAKELQKIYNVSSKDSKNIKDLSKDDICNKMKEELLHLEKFSTGKDKKTYIMIPKDHPIYEFPYNLEDRRDYIKQEIYNFTKSTPKLEISKKNKEYEISMSFNEVNKYKGNTQTGGLDKLLKELGFIEKGKEWIKIIS